ncbi:coadhesin-like [Mytilus trossulus]|uniref:coadhesin-like n=1 Tax=Mytilus trossulus TaxID=6551 RepID=UPI003005C95D
MEAIVVSGRCSKWTCWTPCSVSCGSGSQERRRTCHYPARARYRYRAECGGSRLESRPCTVTTCSIEGNWGNWMDWSTCPVTCGGGMQVRSRLCNNPAPANNGPFCSGPDSERKSCEILPCPIEGNWGNWMDWSPCPVTCGGGMQVRSRLCNNPAPANNGPNCSGPDSERKSCEPLPCPINGNWAGWLSWSLCSVSCGQGAQNRKRTCSNPAPAFNGQDCSGSDSETELCVLTACPINGNWAGWLSWSPCSVSCGQGAQNRKRTCSNPAPAFNGQDCSGSDSETELCVLTACPINGNWAGWLSWSPCSVSCGKGGARNRKRTCSNPEPAFNGQDCSGSGSERQLCVLTECPS